MMIKQYNWETNSNAGRISKIEYYLEIAKAVSKRSTCLRRQYGAVIVKNDEIISTGYNGSPRGEKNCCDCGHCFREQNHIPHGKEYESCLAVHAEQNAIISANRKDMIGATLYLAGFENGKVIEATPCKICKNMLINAGIKYVITTKEQDNNGTDFNRTITLNANVEYNKDWRDSNVTRNYVKGL